MMAQSSFLGTYNKERKWKKLKKSKKQNGMDKEKRKKK